MRAMPGCASRNPAYGKVIRSWETHSPCASLHLDVPLHPRQHPGGTYFFTVTLLDRRARWLVDHVSLLRDCLAATKAQHPFRIDAMVVLPDHLHAIWTLPVEDADFSLRWMLVKRRFTRELLCRRLLDGASLVPRRGSERSLWNRRFWEHQIRDDDDFARHVEYIHFNPVKHGLVVRAGDWPYSSFHRFVRHGIVAADWGLSADPAPRGSFGE
jgi:putative transposase